VNIQSLRLKNFKGIKSGLGIDEVTINLIDTKGIIVFSAPNGAGKTTILDNLHPYRIMPYRANGYRPASFSYYDHVYGVANKELIFEFDGILYRSLIIIDANKRKQEAYLFLKNDEKEEWKVITDGKLDVYDDTIEKICGSPELFFTSIFRSQGAKFLSDYAKGDIKALFVELLNINHLKELGEKALEYKKVYENRLNILRENKRKVLFIIESEEKEKERYQAILKLLEDKEKEMQTLRNKIKELQNIIKTIDDKILEQEKKIVTKKNIEKDIFIKTKELNDLNNELKQKDGKFKQKITEMEIKINQLKKLADKISDYKKYKEDKEKELELVQILKKQSDDIEKNIEELNISINEYNETYNILIQKEKTFETILYSKNTKKKIIENTIDDYKRQIKKLEGLPCGKNLAKSCKFVKDAIEAENKLPALLKELNKIQEEDDILSKLQNTINILKKKITESKIEDIKNELTTLKKNKQDIINQIKQKEEKIVFFDKEIETLSHAENAKEQLYDLESEIVLVKLDAEEEKTKLQEKINVCQKEIFELNTMLNNIIIDKTIYEEKDKKIKMCESLENQINIINNETNKLRIEMGEIQTNIKNIEKAKDELISIQEEEKKTQDEIQDWTILSKAFSDNGIIALEIDDAGPQISSIANELLKIFGGRFSVRFDTQAVKSDGKSLKEVFDITVFDSKTNEAKSIKRLSGGEKTWVEDAITRAICIYNKIASNKNYKTIFTDEKDGALDYEKKIEFFQMKRKVLEIGGYEREFCITQTPEIINMADTVISLENGKITLTNR